MEPSRPGTPLSTSWLSRLTSGLRAFGPRAFALAALAAGGTGASLYGYRQYRRHRAVANRLPLATPAAAHESAAMPQHKSVFLTVLTINDIYEMEPVHGVGGLAEACAIMKRERALVKNCLTTLNGDFLVATAISNIYKGAHMIDIYNLFDFDFCVLGNHEFDYGPVELAKRIKESNFAWLGSNVRQENGKVFPGCIDTKIIQVEELKIGLFGLCTAETVSLSYPGDTLFEDLTETAKARVKQLKSDGADVLIAVTHQWLNEDQDMLRKVPGIDVILGGHDHSPISIFEGSSFIQKSGMNAQSVGKVDLEFRRRPDGSIQTLVAYQLIPVKASAPEVNSKHAEAGALVPVPRDERVAARIQHYMKELEHLSEKHLCVLASSLDTRTAVVRARECNFANMLCDAVREVCQCDAVIIQGGSIRGDRIYPAGHIFTERDLLNEMPFPNTLALIEISGADLKEGLEQGLRYLPARAGCFPQVSGLKYVVSELRPFGQKVRELYILRQQPAAEFTHPPAVVEEPVVPERTYRLACTTFISHGGDGISALARGKQLQHPAVGKLISDLLADKMRSAKQMLAVVDHRAQIVP